MNIRNAEARDIVLSIVRKHANNKRLTPESATRKLPKCLEYGARGELFKDIRETFNIQDSQSLHEMELHEDPLTYEMLCRGVERTLHKMRLARHAFGCTFEEKVFEDFHGSIGDGEVSGSARLTYDLDDMPELSLSDGWNASVYVTFNYCPECGAQLQLIQSKGDK